MWARGTAPFREGAGRFSLPQPADRWKRRTMVDGILDEVVILSRHAEAYSKCLAAAEMSPTGTPFATQDPRASIVRGSRILLADPDLGAIAVPLASNLVWMQSTWAGVAPLLDPRLPRTYRLTGLKKIFDESIAEYVLGYALAHERQIVERYASQQRRLWDQRSPGRLRGRTMLVLGLGSIGTAIARYATFFGMRVLALAGSVRKSPHVQQVIHRGDFVSVASHVDYLVSTLPETDSTTHLVNESVLRALRPTAVFMNVGRGNVVDEALLARALEEKWLARAVLDVFEEEPLPGSSPLWSLNNVFVTGHTAGPSFPEDVVNVFLENLARFQANESLLYEVDFARGY
jgi:phosphoglycerate dehydrogenase-like enzyme